jgi:hypothetical protein
LSCNRESYIYALHVHCISNSEAVHQHVQNKDTFKSSLCKFYHILIQFN